VHCKRIRIYCRYHWLHFTRKHQTGSMKPCVYDEYDEYEDDDEEYDWNMPLTYADRPVFCDECGDVYFSGERHEVQCDVCGEFTCIHHTIESGMRVACGACAYFLLEGDV